MTNLIEDYSFNSDCMSEKGNSICAGDRFTESQVDFSTDLFMGSFEMPSYPNESSLELDRIDEECKLDIVSMSDRLLFESMAEESFMPISPMN